MTPRSQAANLLFALASRRYERGSIIVTSNRSFEQWGEILGDAMVAATLIDRLVHHATVITLLKGKRYRLRERGLGGALLTHKQDPWCTFRRRLTCPARNRHSKDRAWSGFFRRRGSDGSPEHNAS